VLQKYSTMAIAAVVLLAAGCDDGTGFEIQPILITDTVMVAAPLPQNASLPTALDITSDGSGDVGGGRFPELSRDALAWDFLVRVEGGELVLVPAPAAGVTASNAAITPPIEDETFESLREVPGQTSFVNDEAVVMTEGEVYAARSRVLPQTGCFQFAKLEPLQVSVDEGLLEVQIVTNQICSDARLVPIE
jgi:hypothetical protein